MRIVSWATRVSYRAVTTSSKPSFKSFLEVERKFHPSTALTHYLSSIPEYVDHKSCTNFDSGISHELKALRLPDRLIRDTYFDIHDQLFDRGIWIRRRQERAVLRHNPTMTLPGVLREHWESKVRLDGEYNRSIFQEVIGKNEVFGLIIDAVPGAMPQDLKTTTDLETHRRSWNLYDDDISFHFQIVQDSVTRIRQNNDHCRYTYEFKHEVGEVELSAEVVGGVNEEDHKRLRKDKAEEMDRVLNTFMLRHTKLIPTEPRVLGKLSAYFCWKKIVEATVSR